MRVKGRDNVSVENGDCLSKMPAATAEQLNIAKMLSKPGDDVDLRNHVQKLQELTECTEDQAVTALYDCENNLERAVELLLDKFRCGNDEEWHTTGKKTKPKNVPTDIDSIAIESRSEKIHSADEVKNSAVNNDVDAGTMKETGQTDSVRSGRNETWSGATRRDGRGRRTAGASKGGDRRNDASTNVSHDLPVANENEVNHKDKAKTPFDTEGWDPYTEYGEWTGEAIEVVNSNASIEEWCPEQSTLPPELFVDTEPAANRDAAGDNQPTSSVPSVNTTASPSLTTLPEADSLFISKAVSKPPPPAFTNMPDVPVFVVPDLLPRSTSRWAFKFGGESASPAKPEADSSLPSIQPTKEAVSHASCTGLTQPCYSKVRPDSESQDFPSYAPPSPSKSPAVGFDVNKTNPPRSLLEDPGRPETKVEQTSTFTNAHFQNVNAVSKANAAFTSGSKTQPSASFESENGTGQSTFLEPSFKNYLLDGLSSDVNKLSVGEPQNSGTKTSQFSLQQPVSQGPQTQSFSHNQSGAAVSMSSQLNKAALSHISSHNAMHSSQQPVVSSATQSQQPSVTLPPGMPHFIGQYAPPAYHMFNLPGSSSNAPALFELDQLQLLHQQQRIIYDMHLQHQAATTAQSLLPSTADSASTSKPSSHNVGGSMGHVTAAGPGIRPDILASAIGHAPPMLAPGHPYFSYPGLVFMNGYTNAFLNQQQQQTTGQDTNQSQSSTHCGSPITQPQAQSSGQPQSFSGLKQVNAGVGGYDDLLDMKYGDPSKQVGFKNNSNQPNYGSFPGAAGSSDSVGPKLSGVHQSGAGPLTQSNFNTTGGGAHTQHFPPQFFPSAAAAASSYLAAVAAASAAAASAQQQQVSVGGGPSAANSSQSNAGGGGGNNSGQGNATGAGSGSANNAAGQLHLTGNPAQPLVLGATGGNMHHRHHQRSIKPQESPGDGGHSSTWFPFFRNVGFYDPITAGSIDGTDDAPHDRAIVRALSAGYKPEYQSILGVDPKAIIFMGRLPYDLDSETIRKALRKLLDRDRSHRHTSRSTHRSREDRYSSPSGSRKSRRSRSPFATSPRPHDTRHTEPVESEWPKIRLVRNVVTGFSRGYGFAYFRSADEASQVLRNWSRQTRSFVDNRNTSVGGLEIPGGEQVILEPPFAETLPGWKPRRLGGGLGGRKEAGQLRFGGVARPFRRPFTL